MTPVPMLGNRKHLSTRNIVVFFCTQNTCLKEYVLTYKMYHHTTYIALNFANSAKTNSSKGFYKPENSVSNKLVSLKQDKLGKERE